MTGNGKARLEAQLKNVNVSGLRGLRILEKSSAVSPASAIAILGLEKVRRKDFADVASLEPTYLKDFIIHRVN